MAESIAGGHAALVDRLAAGLLKPLPDNFVERPWGGMRMRAYKGACPLPDQPSIGGAGLGEAFEIAAFDADDEARAHPSRLRFEDGSEITLPDLLRAHGPTLLGAPFNARYGGTFPLLPKTLDIKELLSVQGHPEGNTEVYIVIDADPGATLRLGFNADVEPLELIRELKAGRERQRQLLELLRPPPAAAALQTLLQPWLADREVGTPPAEIETLVQAGQWRAAVALLEPLKAVYWRVLDAMNVLPAVPGQIIYNATPGRLLAGTGRAPSAEVHALGNPEQREVLMLEIRRPGPTFRAWDNVRFPLRQVDVEAAVNALNLRRTEPGEFAAPPHPVPGRAGIYESVRSAGFRLEHIEPDRGESVAIPQEPPHSLHVIRGSVVLHTAAGRALGTLLRGESAIVAARVGAYHVAAEGDAGAAVVKVSLPS